MAEVHRLSPMLAQYTKVTKQSDKDGDYLCRSCMMYIPGSKVGKGGCTAIAPDNRDDDEHYISGDYGGCNLYVRGKPAKEANINPNRLSKADGGYVHTGPFSCKRCGNYLGPGQPKCIRVMAGGKDGIEVIEPNECCNAWQLPGEVHEDMDFNKRITKRVTGN